MKEFFVLIAVVGFMIGCNTNRAIPELLEEGAIITIDQAEKTRAVTTGCFGIPTCVRMDDPRRLVVQRVTWKLGMYCTNCTGVTYFLSNYYTYAVADDEQCVAFYNIVNNYREDLRVQVVEQCLSSPVSCEESVEECQGLLDTDIPVDAGIDGGDGDAGTDTE